MDQVQEKLLEIAGQVFAEKGFKSATVREICARAGVNIASVNYYFGDKERLYIEAVKSAHSCRIDLAPTPEWPTGTPATIKLRDFVRMMIRRMVQGDVPTWHFQLIMREMIEPSAACVELVRDTIRPMANLLLDIVSELAPEAPLEKKYMIGFSVVGQCFHYRVHRPINALLLGEENYRRLDADKIADHIADFTLAALGHGPPVGSKGEKS